MTPLDIAINEQVDYKAKIIIDKMFKFNENCSLKFIKKPNRLELKFEKSFVLSVLRNNSELIKSFP